MAKKQSAPVYLDLFRIQFPVGAVTSIAHRVSGLLLFISLPFLVWLLDLSLRDATGFDHALELLQRGWLRLLLVPVVWSLFHHLFAGIRFLLIDLGAGVVLARARASAWLVNLAALLVTIVCAGFLA